MIDLHRQIEAKNRQLEELALTDPLTGCKGLIAILREQDGIVICREGLIYQFAVDRGVIHYQDFKFLTTVFYFGWV